MDPDHGRARAPTDDAEQVDDSFPTLLLVSLVSVLAAVGGVVAVGLVPTTSMLLAAMLLVLLGTVAVMAVITLELADADGRIHQHDARPTVLVMTERDRGAKRRDDEHARRAA
jgi:hypothetical protein